MANEPAVFTGHPITAVAAADELGEGPIWDGRTGTLFWVDILGRRVWRWRPGHGQAQAFDVGEAVGFAVLTSEAGSLILGVRSGLALYRVGEGRPEPIGRVGEDRPGNRLNDGATGPDGSLFFSTMDDAETEPTGRFHRWSAGGVSRFGPEVVVGNGPAIDGLAGVLYASDTVGRTIYRYRLSSNGTPEAETVFCRFGEGDGHPDGMTVDADGHLWVCHFGGGRVTRFDPDGQAVLTIPMPTGQVTKPAFGGPDLSLLYVTSAAKGRDRSTDLQAGNLFAIETGIRGRPADICTVAIA